MLNVCQIVATQCEWEEQEDISAFNANWTINSRLILSFFIWRLDYLCAAKAFQEFTFTARSRSALSSILIIRIRFSMSEAQLEVEDLKDSDLEDTMTKKLSSNHFAYDNFPLACGKECELLLESLLGEDGKLSFKSMDTDREWGRDWKQQEFADWSQWVAVTSRNSLDRSEMMKRYETNGRGLATGNFICLCLIIYWRALFSLSFFAFKASMVVNLVCLIRRNRYRRCFCYAFSTFKLYEFSSWPNSPFQELSGGVLSVETASLESWKIHEANCNYRKVWALHN